MLDPGSANLASKELEERLEEHRQSPVLLSSAVSTLVMHFIAVSNLSKASIFLQYVISGISARFFDLFCVAARIGTDYRR